MNRLSGRTTKALTKLISSHRWIFAKTMPNNPHWYTLRREWIPDDDDFDWMVRVIREFGVDEPFWDKKTYRMLKFGNWKYWTMGAPVWQTILINRKWIGVGDPPTEEK